MCELALCGVKNVVSTMYVVELLLRSFNPHIKKMHKKSVKIPKSTTNRKCEGGRKEGEGCLIYLLWRLLREYEN